MQSGKCQCPVSERTPQIINSVSAGITMIRFFLIRRKPIVWNLLIPSITSALQLLLKPCGSSIIKAFLIIYFKLFRVPLIFLHPYLTKKLFPRLATIVLDHTEIPSDIFHFISVLFSIRQYSV